MIGGLHAAAYLRGAQRSICAISLSAETRDSVHLDLSVAKLYPGGAVPLIAVNTVVILVKLVFG